MYKLVISDDEGKQTTVPLVRDEVTIGRKEGNTIRLTERNVSRRHARLQKQNGNYLLQDLGSYNGIVINGQRLLDSQSLKHGDQILIGDYKLAILEEATSQIQAPPPSSNGVHDTLEAIPPAAPPASKPASNPPMHVPSASPTQRISAPPLAPPPTAAAVVEQVPEEIRALRLVFLAPAGAPAPFALDRLPIILGRSEVADISLPFSSISREHARLSVQGGALVIEDLGSSNGVTVNGEKQPRAALEPGDQVALGVVEFRVARRGDATVVMNTVPGPSEAAAKSRSPLGIVLALAGIGVIGGGVALMMRNGNNPNANLPTASAPTVGPNPTIAAAPATAPVEPPATPTLAVAQPTAAPPVPAAPPQQPEQLPPTPAPVVAMAAPPAAVHPEQVDPPSASTRSSDRSAHASRTAPASSAGSNATATHTTVAAAAQTTTAAAQTTHASNPSPSGANTGSTSATAATSDSGQNLMDQARACRNDNACTVAALEGRARTETEVGLLAVTYRIMGNRAMAVRTMQRYIQRWPSGPRSESFHNYIEAE